MLLNAAIMAYTSKSIVTRKNKIQIVVYCVNMRFFYCQPVLKSSKIFKDLAWNTWHKISFQAFVNIPRPDPMHAPFLMLVIICISESKEVYLTEVSSGSMKELTMLNFGNERCVIYRKPELLSLGTTPIGDVRRQHFTQRQVVLAK